MTARTKAELQSDVASKFATNAQGDITAETTRSYLLDELDSVVFPADLTGTSALDYSPEAVVSGASYTVQATDGVVLISRASPASTAIGLGLASARASKVLYLKDISTSVTSHTITVTPSGSDTIDGKASMTFTSNPAVNVGATLVPSTAAGGWYVL